MRRGGRATRPGSCCRALVAAGLGAAVLAAGCGGAGLWRAVHELDDEQAGPRAAARLRAAGDQGLEVLLAAARVGERESILKAAFAEMKCHQAAFGRDRRAVPARAAARLAVRWLAAAPERARAAEGHPSSLARQLALVSRAQRPADLGAALQRLAAAEPRDTDLLTVAMQATTCAMVPAARQGRATLQALLQPAAELSQQLEARRAARRAGAPALHDCRHPRADRAEELVAGLVAGDIALGGASASNDVLAIGLRRGDRKADLGPACALWLYRRAAEQGRQLPGLLLPLVGDMGLVAPAQRARAARLLLRDLDHYPAPEQNRILAAAVNAGARAERPVAFADRPHRPQAALLEAAARQGSAAARRAIDRALLCRGAQTWSGALIALAGFLPEPQAGELAWRVGRRCPQAAAPALVALLRRGDARAAAMLERVLAAGRGSVFSRVGAALAAHAPPALLDELRAAAAAGAQGARRLLEQVQRWQALQRAQDGPVGRPPAIPRRGEPPQEPLAGHPPLAEDTP